MKAAILLTVALSVGVLTYFSGNLLNSQPGQSAIFDGAADRDLDGFASTFADTMDTAFVRCSYGVRTECVTDGDTIQINGQAIRIADIDAPEVDASMCSAEKIAGEQASQRLMELLNAGPFTVSMNGPRNKDQHDRMLRVVSRHNKSLGETLVAEGLAQAWVGVKHDWCA